MYLQLYRLNTKGQLGVGERCIAGDRQNVKLVVCPLGTVDGPWQYESVRIINMIHVFYLLIKNSNICLNNINLLI